MHPPPHSLPHYKKINKLKALNFCTLHQEINNWGLEQYEDNFIIAKKIWLSMQLRVELSFYGIHLPLKKWLGTKWTVQLFLLHCCCDVAVTQIIYPSLNKQDSIKQVRGQSYKEYLVQIFLLDDMKFFWVGGRVWGYLCYSWRKQSS